MVMLPPNKYFNVSGKQSSSSDLTYYLLAWTPFLDELKDHGGGERFGDRTDSVSGRRGRRLSLAAVDLAEADGAGVKDLAVFGNG